MYKKNQSFKLPNINPMNIITLLILAVVIFALPQLMQMIKGLFSGLSDSVSNLSSGLGSLTGGTQKQQTEIKDASKPSTTSNINPFDRNYFLHAGAGARLVKVAECKRLGKLLVDAFGIVSVDFSQVQSVFHSFVSKSQVSFFCDQFIRNEKKDVISFMKAQNIYQHLTYKLSDQQLSEIIEYCEALPDK